MLLSTYQSRVLASNEIVDYASVIKSVYGATGPAYDLFVGFKVLCNDKRAFVGGNPRERLAYIDQNLEQIVRGKGVIVRETNGTVADGLWIITLPAPRSTLTEILTNLLDVLSILSKYFEIIPQGIIEINVSGPCEINQLENKLCRLHLDTYEKQLIMPDNTPYKYGHIIRINSNYVLFRTRWNLSDVLSNYNQLLGNLINLTQVIASMY